MSTNLKQGDIIWVSFNPQKGHEQAGRRPALVVSRTSYNRHSHMVFVAPITHTDRKSAWHVPIPDGLPVDGFIMCEQTKALDISARNFALICHLPEGETLNSVKTLLGMILS